MGGGVTEDPDPPGTPRAPWAWDEEGAGAQGTQGEVEGSPCARGAAESHRGAIHPQERGSQPLQPSSFSHIRASFRPQAPSSQNRRMWPYASPPHGLLMSQAASLPSVNRGPRQLAHSSLSFKALSCQERLVPRGLTAARQVAERMSRREQRRPQEAWRKRRRCQGEALLAAQADCVEPVEVDPP